MPKHVNPIMEAYKNAYELKPADVWPKPDRSIVDVALAPAPEFPLELFGQWEAWLEKAAQSKSAPVDYVAISLLSAASSLISNVRQGSPYNGWVEPTIIWGILVGSPSSNKSPALDVIRDAFRSIEGDMAEAFSAEYSRYTDSKEVADAKKDGWLASMRKASSNGDPLPVRPDNLEDLLEPPRPRLSISDITIEKAAEIASQNPRGLCLMRDELAGLLANLERHGGSDREFYLESYGGRRYTVDRKKHPDPILIDRLSIAILGTIQPDKLGRLLSQTEDDGFAARFLYAWPHAIEFNQPTHEMDKSYLLNAFNRLRALELRDGCPKELLFDDRAKSRFVKWRKEKLPELEKGEEGIVASFIGKMPGVVVRLATILEYLNWASDANLSEPKQISDKQVFRAIRMVERYLIPMAKRCLNEHAVPQRQRDARRIAQYILKKQLSRINSRQLKRAHVLQTSDFLRYDAAIGLLEETEWLRRVPELNRAAGRKAKTYDVNPHVLS